MWSSLLALASKSTWANEATLCSTREQLSVCLGSWRDFGAASRPPTMSLRDHDGPPLRAEGVTKPRHPLMELASLTDQAATRTKGRVEWTLDDDKLTSSR